MERLDFYNNLGEFRITYDDISYDRVFLMSVETFAMIQEAIKGIFGTGFAIVMLRIGESAGKSAAKYYVQESDVKKRIALSKEVFDTPSEWGWGSYNLEITEEPPFIRLKHYNSAFKDLCYLEGESKTPENHFVAGFFKGYFSTILSKELACTKTKCMAKGDEYCEYELR
jgi:predicted hydrocarbon binding protein